MARVPDWAWGAEWPWEASWGAGGVFIDCWVDEGQDIQLRQEHAWRVSRQGLEEEVLWELCVQKWEQRRQSEAGEGAETEPSPGPKGRGSPEALQAEV